MAKVFPESRRLARNTYSKDGSNVVTDVTNYTMYNWESTSDGGENRDWKADIRRGVCATTSFEGYRESFTFSPMHARLDYYRKTDNRLSIRELSGGWFYAIGFPGDPFTLSVTESDNQAKTRFVRSARRIQTLFQGGVFLGELRETLHMIRNPARALRRGIDSYYSDLKRRGRNQSNANRKRILRDTWLEYSFGWAPLIGDIDRGAKALASYAARTDAEWRTVRVEGKSETSSFSGINLISNGFLRIMYQYLEKGECMTIYLGQVRSSASSKRLVPGTLLGFHPSNFLPTAYELLPWSFLIDYFSNLGDVIDAWALQRSGIGWTQRTVRKSKTRSVFNAQPDWAYINGNFDSPSDPYSFGSASCSPGLFHTSRTSVSRAQYFGNFIPSIEFTIPGFSDTRKWINMSALLRRRKDMVPFYKS